MIINKLKPFVTSFSEVVSKYEHGREVLVGGEIKNVLVMSDFLSYQPDDSEIDLDDVGDLGVYITLDDGVGYNNLVLPIQEYERFKEEHGVEPQPGMIVLARGKVMKMTFEEVKRGVSRTIDKHPEQTTRIATLKLAFVPELNEQESESGN